MFNQIWFQALVIIDLLRFLLKHFKMIINNNEKVVVELDFSYFCHTI
jgi:hypothetical protein